MWSEDIRQNLSKELESQLENKSFFDAKAYYHTLKKDINKEDVVEAPTSILYPSKEVELGLAVNKTFNYENAVKGMSFSNKVNIEKKQSTIDDLSMENRKIYKIADLLSANLAETIIIPYDVKPTSLALVKRFDWKDILFSDLGTAWKMIKNKFNW